MQSVLASTARWWDAAAGESVLCCVRSVKLGAPLIVWFSTQGLLWLHGGYSIEFPYPNVASRGAGTGTALLTGIPEYGPYPSLPYYLNDMWTYNFSACCHNFAVVVSFVTPGPSCGTPASGLWTEIVPLSKSNPSARRAHAAVLSGEVFLMFGGYSNNYYNQEFWIYNICTWACVIEATAVVPISRACVFSALNSWLQKFTFTRPMLPATCSDDTATTSNFSVYGEPTRFTTLDGKYGACRVVLRR